MKKLLIALSIVFLMSGCGEEEKTLSCKSTSTANGVTTNTEYKIKYINEDVKHVTITYDYTQDNNTTNNDNNNMDGANADTDGLTTNKDDTTNNADTKADDVVDGVVGDTIDGIVDTVTDTILDLSGIKSTYENQMSTYDNIDGFKYKVDTDTDNEYKVTYDIDMDKISDSDLTRFNLDRNLKTLRTNEENSGYTCK